MTAGRQTKPHGSFPPQRERGAYILREPKGEPDVLLFSGPEGQKTVYGAADLLSVQGYTARIVEVADAALFLRQDAAYRESVFSPAPSARVGLALTGEEQAAFSSLPQAELLCRAARSAVAAGALAAIRRAD